MQEPLKQTRRCSSKWRQEETPCEGEWRNNGGGMGSQGEKSENVDGCKNKKSVLMYNVA